MGLAFAHPHFLLQAAPHDISASRDRLVAGWDVTEWYALNA